MKEFLKPISEAVRYGLAGVFIVGVQPELNPPPPIPIVINISNMCISTNPTLSGEGSFPVVDLENMRENQASELDVDKLLEGIVSGQFKLDYYQIGEQYQSRTKLQASESGTIDIVQEKTNPEDILPQWVISKQQALQAPLVVTVLQEKRSIENEDGKFGDVYERKLVGYREGTIPEFSYPLDIDSSTGQDIAWGYDMLTIRKIVSNEAALLEQFTRNANALYPSKAACYKSNLTLQTQT